MAILDDDFQGYSIGANVPFGSWIQDPGSFTSQIQAGHAPSGMDRSLKLFGNVGVDPLVTGYLTSFSEFVAIDKEQGGAVLAFANGPNGTGHTFTLLQVRIETDGTLSALGPSGEVLGNSRDAWFQFYRPNFLQINVLLSDVTVLGVKYVNIDCEIALNGVSVISFNVTTSEPVANLTNATSEINRFQFTTDSAFYSAFTLDTLQPIVSYPHPGTPKMIATQAAIEANVLPDSAKLVVIQAPIEVDRLPDSAKIIIFQTVIEVDVLRAAQRRHAEYIHRRHFPGD